MSFSRLALGAMSFLAVLGCASNEAGPVDEIPVTGADIALRPYYESLLSGIELPVAPASPALEKSQAVSRIVVGSCIDEELDVPAFAPMTAEEAQLTFLIGDNVYGDMDSTRRYVNNEPDLRELRASYADLAAKESFVALRAARPMMAVWDDHDYGVNDGGANFPFREFAETIFEQFWGMENSAAATRPGIYDSHIVGPEGQRLQIILLDTRFFRSELTYTDDYGAAGKQRYVPSGDPSQTMLGESQWAWLKAELAKPADLRLLVSSIQVTPNIHGWEAWSTMPLERQRLYDLINESDAADEMIFLSGDRHSAYLYDNTEIGDISVRELTTSSVNKSFADNEVPEEHDPMEIGRGYAFENYGVVDIDWGARTIALQIKDENGDVARETKSSF